jgi:hypothetical protein
MADWCRENPFFTLVIVVCVLLTVEAIIKHSTRTVPEDDR